MKNLLNKKFSLAISSAIACAMPFMLTSISSCAPSKKIQFANFESYMNNDLMSHLEDTYDVQFQWFTVTEMIETKFRDTYDVAIPCGYELVKLYKKGWLQKIDWNRLIPGLTNPLDLYAEPAQIAINQMNDSFRQILGENDFNVLDYGVPYFDQSFVFVYKGEELTFYSAQEPHNAVDNPSWADIFYTISPQCKYADRFGGKTGMLDDAKSLYDISRIMETIQQNPSDPSKWTNQMPEDATIDSLKQTFKTMTSKAQSNWYRLSTDSGQISRIFADHSKHGYNAILSWSGDALYAAQGAGEYEPYTGEQMHTIKPNGVSLDEIDFIVLNKNLQNQAEKLDRVYKVIYDTCLDAYNVSSEEELFSKDGDRYKYWSMQNWDTVSYTPMLKSIYDNVVNINSHYWDDFASETDIATRELMTSLITFPQEMGIRSIFGKPLSALQNSNTHWAWLETRGNL
ncbi:MAG: hypothetical protein KBS35_00625 [Mycoplasma sp.]|nr:hypothetical protein [Candidatus Hennigella equi]